MAIWKKERESCVLKTKFEDKDSPVIRAKHTKLVLMRQKFYYRNQTEARVVQALRETTQPPSLHCAATKDQATRVLLTHEKMVKVLDNLSNDVMVPND